MKAVQVFSSIPVAETEDMEFLVLTSVRMESVRMTFIHLLRDTR